MFHHLIASYSILIIRLIIIKADNKCMECASLNLKGRWALTGFAQKFRDQSFSAACISGTDMDHYTMCSGYCMTYLFQDPETIGTSNIELMVVRGCQHRLLGMQQNLANAATSAAYCEYDKDLPRLDSQGNTVYIRALVEFCNGDTCNTKVKDFSTKCDAPAETASNVDRLCYSCDAMDKNCNYNKEQCNKKYCFKSIVKFGDVNAVHKSCSDINLFGSENGCTSTGITTVPGSLMKLNGEMTQCYCNDKDYCNGTSTITLSVSFFAAFIILDLFIIGFSS